MAMYNASVINKELRKASGLTQEKLAEGVCTRSTVTMIEQGKRKPDWFTFKRLLQKLGVDPSLYYSDIASDDEVYVSKKHDECAKLAKVWDFDALKAQLDEMEQDKRFSAGEGRRTYLRVKSIVYNQGPYQNNEIALDCLYEQIKMYRPNFELAKIPDYHL